MELGPERRGQKSLHHRWLRPEIDEQPSLDRAFNDRNTHATTDYNACNGSGYRAVRGRGLNPNLTTCAPKSEYTASGVRLVDVGVRRNTMRVMRRIVTVTALFAMWLCAMGCQTFRAPRSVQSESEQARDQKTGEVVETVGTAFYRIYEIMGWVQ